MKLTAADLLEAFRRMRTIREFEDRVHVMNEKGEIPGFIHLSAGQEASAVGICMHLSTADHIASTHRGHGHALAKGCDLKGNMAKVWNLPMIFALENNAMARRHPPSGRSAATCSSARAASVSRRRSEKTATVLTATLACGHRAIDGALGARFMQAFRGFVEAPATMLM